MHPLLILAFLIIGCYSTWHEQKHLEDLEGRHKTKKDEGG